MSDILSALRKKWTDFVQKLAQQNQSSFGNQRLDCCSVDKGQKKHRS